VRVAGVEQVYAYLAPSAVSPNGEVTLATSGGREPHPHFFSGFLGNPRQTAQALSLDSTAPTRLVRCLRRASGG
jgi:hypothetical protein